MNMHKGSRYFFTLNATCFCRPRPDHYFPDLHHLKFEIEEGTMLDDRPVRFGYNPVEFPDFSWRGYAQMSPVQVGTLHLTFNIGTCHAVRIWLGINCIPILLIYLPCPFNLVLILHLQKSWGIKSGHCISYHLTDIFLCYFLTSSVIVNIYYIFLWLWPCHAPPEWIWKPAPWLKVMWTFKVVFLVGGSTSQHVLLQSGWWSDWVTIYVIIDLRSSYFKIHFGWYFLSFFVYLCWEVEIQRDIPGGLGSLECVFIVVMVLKSHLWLSFSYSIGVVFIHPSLPHVFPLIPL